MLRKLEYLLIQMYYQRRMELFMYHCKRCKIFEKLYNYCMEVAQLALKSLFLKKNKNKKTQSK